MPTEFPCSIVKRVKQGDSKDDGNDCEAQLKQAQARVEQAKTRAEQAETRTEQVETRIEQIKTRAEQAETRTEQAELHAEKVEAVLQSVLHKEDIPIQGVPTELLKRLPEPGVNGDKESLEQLTERQREILRLIAEGQNTKSIADLLKISPKTVEYHRMKLMAGLDLRDIPSLVRYAIRVGLIAPEK